MAVPLAGGPPHAPMGSQATLSHKKGPGAPHPPMGAPRLPVNRQRRLRPTGLWVSGALAPALRPRGCPHPEARMGAPRTVSSQAVDRSVRPMHRPLHGHHWPFHGLEGAAGPLPRWKPTEQKGFTHMYLCARIL